MRIAIFGATGRTGQPLVSHALDRGHDVVAHTRSPDALSDHDRLTVVVGDAYTGEGVHAAVEGADAVASVLGQSESSPDDLLTAAGHHILAAMEGSGVSRIVVLVGAGVRDEDEAVSLGGKIMGGLLRLFARDVVTDAAEHARHVRSTDLDWTVLRVPRLGEGDPLGDYRIGDIALGFEAVDRADVAMCILDRLEADDYHQAMPKVGRAEEQQS